MLALAGCVDSNPPIGDDVTSEVARLDYPLNWAPQLDLLVVVDPSPAMAAYRDNVAANLPRMIDAFYSAGSASLHLGVVSADLDDDAAFASDDAIHGDFVVDLRLTDGNRARNYDGELRSVFARLATPRTDGAARAQPLEAMRRALTLHPTFHRDSAALMVVFVMATDDASDRAPEKYVAVLQQLQPRSYLLAITAAIPTAACGGMAPRLSAFAAQFGVQHAELGICDADLTPLTQFASIKTSLVGPPCLPPTVSTCAAELAFDDGRVQRLPACDEGVAPCWRLERDPQNCPAFGTEDTGDAYIVQRALLDEIPLGTYVHADCLLDSQ